MKAVNCGRFGADVVRVVASMAMLLAAGGVAAAEAEAQQLVAPGMLESIGAISWYAIAIFVLLCVGVSALFLLRGAMMRFVTKSVLLVGTLITVSLALATTAVVGLATVALLLIEVFTVDIGLTVSTGEAMERYKMQSLWLQRVGDAVDREVPDTALRDQSIERFRELGEEIATFLDQSNEIARTGLRTKEDMRAKYARYTEQINAVRAARARVSEKADAYFAFVGRESAPAATADAGEAARAQQNALALEQGRALQAEVQAEAERLGEALLSLETEVTEATVASIVEVIASEQATLGVLMILGILGIGFSILLAWLVLRSIIRQVGGDPADLARTVRAISRGRLDFDVSDARTGAYLAIAQTVEKLQEIVASIASGAEVVTQAATEVGQGTSNLSQRTQEQASNLEEVAASMEEMTATVNQNAENALRASAVADKARDQAVHGGDVVARSVAGMDAIRAASTRIADIVGVIDDIAFQTNLLALNASVEAARAGEQGRGFAVVASEVRNLAGRSATAAKEIKSLIEDSGEKVEEGTKLVADSGELLETIVASVKDVSQIVAEISAASQEQSSGINQVNQAVAQMDETTQQNSALVEENAAAAEAMGTEADLLREAIAFFRLDAARSEELARKAGRTRSQRRSSGSSTGSMPATSRPAGDGRSNALPEARRGDDDGDWREF